MVKTIFFVGEINNNKIEIENFDISSQNRKITFFDILKIDTFLSQFTLFTILEYETKIVGGVGGMTNIENIEPDPILSKSERVTLPERGEPLV